MKVAFPSRNDQTGRNAQTGRTAPGVPVLTFLRFFTYAGVRRMRSYAHIAG